MSSVSLSVFTLHSAISFKGGEMKGKEQLILYDEWQMILETTIHLSCVLHFWTETDKFSLVIKESPPENTYTTEAAGRQLPDTKVEN